MKKIAILGIVLTLLISAGACGHVQVESDTENGAEDTQASVEKDYSKLTTGGKNAPYEVRFGDVSKKERKTYKDLNLLVIDTAFGDASDIKALHENGNKRVLCYINVGSLDTEFVTDGRFDDLKLGKYEGWDKEFWVDVRNERWKEFIYEQAKEIEDLGFDGFFVDNLDVYGYYHKKDGMFEACLEILNELAKIKKDIVINGGDEFVTRAMSEKLLDKDVISINQEYFYTDMNDDDRDEETEKLIKEKEEYLAEYFKRCKDYGITIYLLEYGYVDPVKLEKIRKDCEKNGFTYYLSKSEYLDERWD